MSRRLSPAFYCVRGWCLVFYLRPFTPRWLRPFWHSDPISSSNADHADVVEITGFRSNEGAPASVGGDAVRWGCCCWQQDGGVCGDEGEEMSFVVADVVRRCCRCGDDGEEMIVCCGDGGEMLAVVAEVVRRCCCRCGDDGEEMIVCLLK